MPEVTNQDSSRRRFELLRCIGKGGFGEVYQARLSTASGFSKTVAVKILRSDVEGMEQIAARLRDEARMLGLISYPAIVQAQDLINLAGRPAVVMEYVPGVNLSWLINPKRFEPSLPDTIVLAVIRDVAGALNAAFNRPSTVTGKPLEVLHRDVKPGNIRVTPDGVVKILDFGIARPAGMEREAETKAHQLGSLGYMAPELLVGGGASPASDVYALGVVFYECLVRKRFGWPQETAEAHDGRVAKRLAAAARDEGLVALLSEMLAFDPERRPTAADVRKRCRRLERAIEGPMLEEWAHEALSLVDAPGDPEDVELTGKTLFEESSVFTLPVRRSDGSAGRIEPRRASTDETSAAGEDPESTRIEPLEPVTELFIAPPERRRAGPLIWGMAALALMITAALAFVALRHWGRQQVGLEPTDAEVVESQPPAEPMELPSILPAVPIEEVELTELEELPAGPAEEPSSARPDAPSTTAAKATARVRSPRPAPEPAEEPAAPVTVRLSSVPFGIEVYVDGKSQGKTPITTELVPGRHALMFLDGEDTLRTEVVVEQSGSNFFNYVRAEGKVR